MRQLIEVMKMIGDWFSRFFRWFIVEPKKFWFTLLPVFVGIIFCSLIPLCIFNGSILDDTLDTRFRLTGLFLELLGIIAVVHGLNETLKLHLGDHLLDIIPKWFKRFPKFRVDHHIVVSNITSTLGPIFSSCNTTKILSPNSSIENRVTFLEEQFKQVLFQLDKNRIDFENEFKKLSNALSVECSKREDGDKQAQQALKEFAVGDVYKEVMGITWLFFGAIFATASEELANFFG